MKYETLIPRTVTLGRYDLVELDRAKEQPVLFSGPMVRAILEGRKTQTRRVIGKQPMDILPCKGDWAGKRWVSLDTREPQPSGTIFGCKYGVPGDRLWVRETFYEPMSGYTNENGDYVPVSLKDRALVRYVADGGEVDTSWRSTPKHCLVKRPSIHMPRWASRITLEIVNVRVQRLALISQRDCKAEGVGPECTPADPRGKWRPDRPYFEAFWRLWNSINEKRGHGWNSNPWVWVIEFKRID